ncbi:class E sortase [Streptomyces sp. NPDC056144]|uniref:class E sortase n=1 Tax=unclassified Streptomyces TaxID=2593676 RepID=UPI0035DC08F8
MRDRARDSGRDRVPVVVQGRRRGRTRARVLWVGAETVVTCGVLVLLLVVHQLWWTNREARADALEQVSVLEREWGAPSAGLGGGGEGGGGVAEGEGAAEFEDGVAAEGEGDVVGGGEGGAVPGGGTPSARAARPSSAGAYSRAFAVIRIPRIGLTAPVAAGVSKRSVLDKGYVGHYPGTAGPGQVGNFALAGHRNTHGEPFRYINRLVLGDRIVVRTRQRTYTYRVDRILSRTSPRDVGVVRDVPRSVVKPSYGYTAPGSYLTLTTCTPEFSSAYRLVVWAKLEISSGSGNS